MSSGCFLISRAIFESPIWNDDPHRLKLFLYLIGQARHNEKPKRFSTFTVERGELVTSLADIASDNPITQKGKLKVWSRAKVSRMLNYLEKHDYIEILTDTYGTHIRVLNYDRYQTLENYKRTGVKQVCNGSATGVQPYKNGNNGNNGNKQTTRKKMPPEKTVIFSRKFYEYLTANGGKESYTEKQIEDGARVVDQLVRIDDYKLEGEVGPALWWGLNDEFWSGQIRSLAQLRKKTKGSANTKFDNLFDRYSARGVKGTRRDKTIDAFRRMLDGNGNGDARGVETTNGAGAGGPLGLPLPSQRP